MIFNTWEERTQFLGFLQESLQNRFGNTGYNVLIFGSFLTDEYKPGVSDIDLAVYADDFQMCRDIYDFLADFLEERNIPKSLIIIDVEQKHAFIALEPLRIRIGCTSYYPVKLQEYHASLLSRFIYWNEEREMIRKRFPVKY